MVTLAEACITKQSLNECVPLNFNAIRCFKIKILLLSRNHINLKYVYLLNLLDYFEEIKFDIVNLKINIISEYYLTN